MTNDKTVILNVDDNEAGRYATTRMLAAAGYAVIEAATGAGALRKVADEHPDLVVLDTNLPDIDGYEVCNRIKKHRPTSTIPVLHLSAAHTDAASRVKGLEGGADGYLTQPVEPLVLLATVKALLRLRAAEAETVAMAAQWSATFDSIADAICLLDTEGRILRFNKAFSRLSDKSAGEIVGHYCYEMIHGTTAFIENCPFVRAMSSGRRESCDSALKGGWFSISVDPVFDVSGEIVSLVHIMSDITERKSNENRLRESEERFRATFDQAAVGIAHVSPEGRWIRVNQKLCDIVGYSREELLAKIFQDITHPDDLDADLGYVRQMLAGEISIYSLEKRYFRKDGSLVWINLTVALVRGESGQPKYFISVVEDITKRKRAEADAKREQVLSNTIIDSIPGTFYVLDEHGRYTRWNNYHRDEILGKPEEQIAGMNAIDTIHPEDRVLIQARIANVLQDGKEELVESRVLLRGGPVFIWMLLTGRRMMIAGRPFLVGAGIDITERKQADEVQRRSRRAVLNMLTDAIEARERAERMGLEIHELNAELEQRVAERTAQLETANKELEAFSYSVSHDLRAPLRAVDGYTRMLLEDYESKLDAEGKRICAVISESARDMGKLIDDLLAFSRVGRADMAASVVDMATMAHSIFFEVTTPEARERIDFRVGSLPAAVGDPNLLRQVWRNLLSNAVKFSSKLERATIEVGGAAQGDELVFFVRDDGAGFDMQYVGKLFGVFQRLHGTTEFEGTGVGLAIVERIVKRHGGRVWAEGETGQGATFSFALPGGAPQVVEEGISSLIGGDGHGQHRHRGHPAGGG